MVLSLKEEKTTVEMSKELRDRVKKHVQKKGLKFKFFIHKAVEDALEKDK